MNGASTHPFTCRGQPQKSIMITFTDTVIRAGVDAAMQDHIDDQSSPPKEATMAAAEAGEPAAVQEVVVWTRKEANARKKLSGLVASQQILGGAAMEKFQEAYNATMSMRRLFAPPINQELGKCAVSAAGPMDPFRVLMIWRHSGKSAPSTVHDYTDAGLSLLSEAWGHFATNKLVHASPAGGKLCVEVIHLAGSAVA